MKLFGWVYDPLYPHLAVTRGSAPTGPLEVMLQEPTARCHAWVCFHWFWPQKEAPAQMTPREVKIEEVLQY